MFLLYSVLAKDEFTGEVAYKEVEWLYQRDVTEIYQVHVEDEVIETTAEHLFWVQGVGWVKTQDLKSGDIFETADGRTLIVDKVVKQDKKTTVYNFKVKDFHTYYVSNLKVFTHNMCYFNAKSNRHINERHIGNVPGREHKSKWTLTGGYHRTASRKTIKKPHRVTPDDKDPTRTVYERISKSCWCR
ncbi:hypothetical protein IC620_15185 [Hazenella sp. IB182357]|uniref:Intein C-terminal splicing domain-containing protein n=1 Tax=Polycladospora coralii TaxID=2771432 RepID=A0A926NHK2_9BACL|nr:hypothetical protein [Polycladospora coralii]